MRTSDSLPARSFQKERPDATGGEGGEASGRATRPVGRVALRRGLLILALLSLAAGGVRLVPEAAGAAGEYLAAGQGGPPRGDIVVVRSYGTPFLNEFEAAAGLLLQGRVSFILAAVHEPRHYQRMVGVESDQRTRIAGFFLRRGIPRERFDVVLMPDRQPVLIEDARSLGHRLSSQAGRRGWKRVVLVARQFRSRRVLWAFRTHGSGGTALEYVPWSISIGLPTRRWWTDNESASEVVGEYLKLAHSMLRPPGPPA